MKLYAHHAGKVLPITLPDGQTISNLCQRLSDVLKYQSVKVSKFPGGKEIQSEISISTFFDNMDDVWIIKTEEAKQEAAPHLPAPQALQYTSLSKYSFYEYDSNWVRVEVPFEGIGKHDKGKISCKFDENSFVLSIHDYKGKNYQFSVLRLQCKINPGPCRYSVLNEKIRISLKKVKETDNWFSLFKTKTVGGDD